MGYGGALIWTGLAKNLKRNFPKKKIVLVYTPSLKNLVLLRKNTDFEIYKNNSDISLVTNSICWFFLKFIYGHNTIAVDLNDTSHHYWVDDSEEKMTYKKDGHAIEIACKSFALDNITLETNLELTSSEIVETKKILNFHNLLNKKYICIEPNTKKTFTENKQWPWEHWESLVLMLSSWISENNSDLKIVQIGTKGSPLLKGVVDLTGKTTFRHLKKVLSDAHLIIANEGGIAHLATSTQTKTLIISNPSLPQKLMAYPQNVNFFPEKGIHDCGLKKPCAVCQELLRSISSEIVFESVKNYLKK